MLWRMSADILTETSATMSISQHTDEPALSAAGPYSGGKVFPKGVSESVSIRSFLRPGQKANLDCTPLVRQQNNGQWVDH